MAYVSTEDLCPGVRMVSLGSPDGTNALTGEMAVELAEKVSLLRSDTLRVVILSGTGRFFSTAGDEQTLLSPSDIVDPRSRNLALRNVIASFMTLFQLKVPIIAAINGDAVGPGFYLACACDYRIADEEARLGSSAMKWGRYPILGSTLTLPRLVGGSRALEIFSGREVSAREAHSMGLVERVAARGRAVAESKKMALELCEAAPFATALLLGRLRVDQDLLVQAIRHETESLSQCLERGEHEAQHKAAAEERSSGWSGSERRAKTRQPRLYLMRHGSTVRRQLRGQGVELPLTSSAVIALKDALARLKKHGVFCRQILASPSLRALQTAELARVALNARAVTPCAWLRPGGAFEDHLWSDLSEDTLCVGHEPDLSELCSFLITGARKPAREPLFTLQKGGVACLERLPSRAYKLVWLLNPRDSRAGAPVIS